MNIEGKNISVSVLMACYNEEKHVARAIESILNQTLSDFTFVIVDDFSTDKTVDVIQEYARQDKRIKFFRNERNRGLAYSLNSQINHINSSYIVRMDADDISYPYRLKQQVDFMELNPEIDAVGSNADVINEDGEVTGEIVMAQEPDELYKQRYRKSTFIHPSVCFRRSFFAKFGDYDESQLRAQDLDLWLRALNRGAKLYNLSGRLLRYFRPESTSDSSFQYAVRAKFRNMKQNRDLLAHGHRLVYDVCRHYVKKKVLK